LITTTLGCFLKSAKALHFCRLSLFSQQGSPTKIIVVLL